VLYWYQSHGRAEASEYWAKYYLVADAIRLNRTDGALVRVVTPVSREETMATAEARAVSFSQKFLPILDRYVPNWALGHVAGCIENSIAREQWRAGRTFGFADEQVASTKII